MQIHISKGNSKMGSIGSVSLPSMLTCRRDAPCFDRCYARKIERLRPNVKRTYEENFKILNESPEVYWREVEASIMMSRFFRYHVSGDIPDNEYLEHMVEIAGRNRHCEMLCFTKRYDFVNTYLDSHNTIPENLHIVFSVWDGLACPNPNRLPEAHILYKNKTSTATDIQDREVCAGNCTECAIGGSGCWSLTTGGRIIINEH